MKFGLGIPHAGAAAQGASIIRFAQRADVLGFESLWCGDHIILPTAGTNQYPYTDNGSFSRPSWNAWPSYHRINFEFRI